MLYQLINFSNFSLRIVLKHLNLMALMIFEATSAKREAMVQTEVDELLLVLSAVVAVAFGEVGTYTHSCHRLQVGVSGTSSVKRM